MTYAPFSKVGFTERVGRLTADRDDLHLFTVDEVVASFGPDV